MEKSPIRRVGEALLFFGYFAWLTAGGVLIAVGQPCVGASALGVGVVVFISVWHNVSRVN